MHHDLCFYIGTVVLPGDADATAGVASGLRCLQHPSSIRARQPTGPPFAETEPPRLLTLSECRALPVSFGASENSFGSDHCPSMMYYAPGFGYNNDQGICLFFTTSGTPASYADAQAQCASMDADAVLWAPRDDAERCLLTDLLDVTGGPKYFTGIIDAQADGVYEDHEGVPIPDAYLNWGDTNEGSYCAAVGNFNDMGHVLCDNFPSVGQGNAVCIKRLPAL